MKYTFNDLDERIVKTRLALYKAIFEIIKANTTVKVLDICKEANITPMTYYHHFNNKNQLLVFAIKNQFENKMPIPAKLKPTNIRQLIAYLIRTYSEFVLQNSQLLSSSYNKILTKGFDNSYIQILLNTSKEWIFNELNLLNQNYDVMTKNIIANFITYGLINTLIRRTVCRQNCKFVNIWSCIKLLLN